MNSKLTKGSLWKGIFLFTLPLVLTNLLQVLFNMTDVAVVGKFGSAIGLGSVGSTTTLVTLFTGFLIGLGNGVNVIIARFIGQKDDKGLHDSLHTGFLISIIMGLVIMAFGMLISRPLLSLMNTKSEFIDGASCYLLIYFIGMPAMAIYNFGNGTYSAKGDTKRPLIFLSIAGIFNVGLDLLFVIVFHLDVIGVALASVISQYVSAFLVVFSLVRSKNTLKLYFKDLKFYKGRSLPILSLGIPSGFQSAIFAIANIFIQSGVNSFDSVIVKANSACLNADSITFNTMAAVYTACASFMSQNFGAGKRDRVIKSYFISLLYSFLVGAILGCGFLLLGNHFLALFSNEDAVIEAGVDRLKIMAFSYAFSAFMDNTIAASRGIGKTFLPTVIVICGSCLFRILWIYTIFKAFHTIEVLYMVYICSWVITAIFEIIYFAFAYKKQIKLIKTEVC